LIHEMIFLVSWIHTDVQLVEELLHRPPLHGRAGIVQCTEVCFSVWHRCHLPSQLRQ
jgi:hypothetical protein